MKSIFRYKKSYFAKPCIKTRKHRLNKDKNNNNFSMVLKFCEL